MQIRMMSPFAALLFFVLFAAGLALAHVSYGVYGSFGWSIVAVAAAFVVASNMLYEGLKQNATIVLVPSTAHESMQLGGLAGITALTMGLGNDSKIKEAA